MKMVCWRASSSRYKRSSKAFEGIAYQGDSISYVAIKCEAIINIRSPVNIKEVQRLTRRMAAFPGFLQRVETKDCLIFSVYGRTINFSGPMSVKKLFGN